MMVTTTIKYTKSTNVDCNQSSMVKNMISDQFNKLYSFLLIYHISLFMNSRRMLANSRSFAQNSRSFQGKKAHFRIEEVFQDKTQIQGVCKASANPVLQIYHCHTTLEETFF